MGLLDETVRRLGYLLRRARFDNELDQEVQFHIDARTEELVDSGLSQSDAIAQAKREFGSDMRMREHTRSAWHFRWLEDLLSDLRYAARSFRRNPAFAITAITCLALGIGANTTIFSLSTEMLLSKPSSRDSQSIAQIWIGSSNVAPVREYRFIRDSKIFEDLAGENEETQANWREGDNSQRLYTVRVTDNFFSVIGIPVAMGRPIEPGDSDVTVLTYRFWQRRFLSDPNVIGRKMILDGRPHIVIGVLPADHRTVTGFGFAPDLYLPLSDDKTSVTLYARLPQGITRQGAYGQVLNVCRELDRIYPRGDYKWSEGISVSSISGFDHLVGNDQMLPITAFFAMLMVVVWLVLFIACANVASLLLARASSRSHEIAIRLSVGASRIRIVRQLMSETFLLALCGTAAGLMVNVALTSFLSSIQLPLPIPVQLVIRPDWRLLGYSVMVALACTLAAGLIPAIKATCKDVGSALKQDCRQTGQHNWSLRNLLVIGQLAISIVLLCTGLVFMRNLLHASTMSPGFDLEHTLWADMRLVPEVRSTPDKSRSMIAESLSQLRSLPGVQSVSIAGVVPLNGHMINGGDARIDNNAQTIPVQAMVNYVGADYFKTMAIQILQGREFQLSDRLNSPPVAIINENMARLLFGNDSPIGHTIRFISNVPVTIVGVANNSKYFTLGEENTCAYYQPYAQMKESLAELHFLISVSNNPEGLISPVNQTLGRIDPSAAIETKPMSRALGFALLPSRAGAGILGSVGVLGLALAAIGLYGVLAYSVSGRVREIGLRVALGATPGCVLWLVLRQSLTLAIVGITIGIALSLLAVRPLSVFLTSEVNSTDPANFVAVAFVLCIVAIIASAAPAMRALRVDPGIALRNE